MIVTKKIRLQTKGNTDIIDITPQVENILAETNLVSGTVTVFATGSTLGITTIENETGLLADFKKAWERIVPENLDYQHNLALEDASRTSSAVVRRHVGRRATGTLVLVPAPRPNRDVLERAVNCRDQ